MELLLNLLWLTLALPALWLWRRESFFAQGRRRFDRVRPCLILSCILMLLFPVVSATDDLRALRQEMEESSSSKKLVKQAVGDKSLTRLSTAGALPALVFPVWFGRDDRVCGQVLVPSLRSPEQRRIGKSSSRAPPFSRFNMLVQVAA
jgi:hypothetical protein